MVQPSILSIGRWRPGCTSCRQPRFLAVITVLESNHGFNSGCHCRLCIGQREVLLVVVPAKAGRWIHI